MAKIVVSITKSPLAMMTVLMVVLKKIFLKLAMR